MGRAHYRPDDCNLPVRTGTDTWRGQFGEARVLRGVPPPEARSFQADMFWLLDNILKVGECMDITRGHDAVRNTVSQYRRARQAPLSALKVRQLVAGKTTRIWKLADGYEKPDAAQSP